MKLFGYLKKSKLTVLVIFLLLVIQAFCELSLPAYTSDIIDIGIQQGGINNAVPEKIRAGTLEDLMLFMSEDSINTVENSYSDNGQGIYVLNTNDKDTKDKLDSIFKLPMVVMSQMNTGNEMSIDQIRAALDSGYLTGDELINQANAMIEQNGISESMLTQMSVLFLKSEYSAIGMDLDKLQTDYLIVSGLKMLGLTLLMITAAILSVLLSSRLAAKIGMELRENVFKKVVSFSNTEMDRFSTASLITRNTNDVQQVQMVMIMILRIVLYAPILGIGGILRVANTHTGLGWIIAVALGAIMLIIGSLLMIAMPKFKIMQKLIDRLNLVSREILTGIPVIRAFSRQKYEENRFDTASRELMKTQLFTNRVMAFMMPILMLIMNTITVGIIWFGAHGVDLGKNQVGDIIAFISYTIQIVMAFMMISAISIMLPRAKVSVERISEIINTEPVIKDKPESPELKEKVFEGRIEFKNVSFNFSDTEAEVLDNISFTAEPGQITAVIGSTGSGKSTLVQLIPRLYDVTDGCITIDGIDIRDISLKRLRSMMGFVPQKGVLFSGDIQSNIKFGGDDITDAAMIEAARIAQAEEFIEQKTEKYNSQIAQGGSNVSGGQKQRISIARAIAKDPKIYIFDDSFSALDYKTDIALRRALSEKTKKATVIIVAQRISTILHADRIIVLDKGSIAGMGTHTELMESCEAYKEIARSQLSAKELGEEAGDINE